VKKREAQSLRGPTGSEKKRGDFGTVLDSISCWGGTAAKKKNYRKRWSCAPYPEGTIGGQQLGMKGIIPVEIGRKGVATKNDVKTMITNAPPRRTLTKPEAPRYAPRKQKKGKSTGHSE